MNDLDLHLKRARDILKNKKVPDLYDLISLTYLERMLSEEGIDKEQIIAYLIENGIIKSNA